MLCAPIDLQFSEHDVVQPDIIVVLKDNKIITHSKINGSPDLVVEILSPSTSKRDKGLKKELYEQNGVPEYWVVDPDEQAVRKFTLSGNSYDEPQRFTDSITFDGLPNVSVDLTQVW